MNVTKIAAALAVILMMTVVAAPAVTAEDSVDLTATVLEPKPEIGIELNATALSFGSLYPGNTSSPQDLKVTNIGLKTVDVTATASDDGTEPLFVPGLLIDGAAYGGYSATLSADEFDDAQLALHVPDDYASRGDVSGGATFWAEEHVESSPVTHFTYASNGSAVTITGYVGPGGDVIIPSRIDDLPVTKIGDMAFIGKQSITSVVIPDSVIMIGSGAFSSCYALTSAIIGNGVTTISDLAFWEDTALTSVTFGSSLLTIGERAFDYCPALTSVTFPDSLTTLGNAAFYNCGLTAVTFGNGLTSIGQTAFRGCTALTSVTIPDSVTSIGPSAFRSCTALTSVTIGSGVTSIGDYAFRSDVALTSMTFEGNAPTVGTDWVKSVPTTMIVYYHPGATGFTDPWNGFTTVELSS